MVLLYTHYHFSSHERYLASMVYQTAPKKMGLASPNLWHSGIKYHKIRIHIVKSLSLDGHFHP